MRPNVKIQSLASVEFQGSATDVITRDFDESRAFGVLRIGPITKIYADDRIVEQLASLGPSPLRNSGDWYVRQKSHLVGFSMELPDLTRHPHCVEAWSEIAAARKLKVDFLTTTLSGILMVAGCSTHAARAIASALEQRTSATIEGRT